MERVCCNRTVWSTIERACDAATATAFRARPKFCDRWQIMTHLFARTPTDPVSQTNWNCTYISWQLVLATYFSYVSRSCALSKIKLLEIANDLWMHSAAQILIYFVSVYFPSESFIFEIIGHFMCGWWFLAISHWILCKFLIHSTCAVRFVEISIKLKTCKEPSL